MIWAYFFFCNNFLRCQGSLVVIRLSLRHFPIIFLISSSFYKKPNVKRYVHSERLEVGEAMPIFLLCGNVSNLFASFPCAQ